MILFIFGSFGFSVNTYTYFNNVCILSVNLTLIRNFKTKIMNLF